MGNFFAPTDPKEARRELERTKTHLLGEYKKERNNPVLASQYLKAANEVDVQINNLEIDRITAIRVQNQEMVLDVRSQYYVSNKSKVREMMDVQRAAAQQVEESEKLNEMLDDVTDTMSPQTSDPLLETQGGGGGRKIAESAMGLPSVPSHRPRVYEDRFTSLAPT